MLTDSDRVDVSVTLSKASDCFNYFLNLNVFLRAFTGEFADHLDMLM